jgi:DNA (cytosine-5)-methyltransferase 1
MPRNPAVIDFFAGAGGLSLGALRAGFDVFGAIEFDAKALDTHKRNFPNSKHFPTDLSIVSPTELRKLVGVKKGEIDGIIGGPPCQGFSIMGYRNENDIRNNLFEKFFDFVMEFCPAFFVAENVLGILDDKYEMIRKRALVKLEDNYIVLPPQKVNASEYGAPTTRTRIFFIGYDKKKLKSIDAEDFLKAKVPEEDRIKVKDALAGLPEDVSRVFDGKGKLSSGQQKGYKDEFYQRISGMIPKNVGDKDYVAEYENKRVVSGCLPTLHSDKVKKRYSELGYGRQDKVSKSIKLNPEGFCPTLRAGTGPERGSYQAIRPIHYKIPRVITPREAARLQGFPDWFDFQPTIWHSFRQIGNSVSPIVAERILSVIRHKFT